MFGKFSVLTFIAAVALIAAVAPAPVEAQVEGYAVVGYGFRSGNEFGYGTSGPLVRAGALYRVGPVALGGEIGHYWLGETRQFDGVRRNRILTITFCMEFGKPRPGISPRVTLGLSMCTDYKKLVTKFEANNYTYMSSEMLGAPHIGLVMVRKPVTAALALRAEVRTALIIGLVTEPFFLHLLTSVSVGVAF